MTLVIASAALGPDAQITITTTGVAGVPAQQITFRKTDAGLLLWRSESLPSHGVAVDEGRDSSTRVDLPPLRLCQSE